MLISYWSSDVCSSDLRKDDAMAQIDIEALRERIRQMDFERGTPEQLALWREDVAESRANLVLEDMTQTIADEAMFAMLLDEGLPPALMPSIILDLYPPGPRQTAAPNSPPNLNHLA